MYKKLRNVSVLVLMFAILVCPLFIESANAEGEINPQTKEPRLYIQNEDLPQVTIGEEFDLNLLINNDSIYTAKEVKVTPVLDGEVFESCELMTTKDITSIVANKSSNIGFKFRISEKTQPGVYPLTFKLQYRNMYKVYYGENGERTRTIYLKVVDTKGLPKVDVTTLKVNPDKVKAGQFADITLTIENSGTQEAKDVELILNGLSASSFSIYNDLNSRKQDSLAGGAKTSFTYKLKADDSMQTGGHKLAYTVKFKDKFDREYSRESEIYLAVLAKDDVDEEDDSKTVPKIIVSEYGTSPSVVNAGGKFQMSLAFFNTSKIKAVRNIKISLGVNEKSSTSGNIFAPVNSSNTLYIDELDPQSTAYRTMDFQAVNDAQPKTYNVIVTFEYEDKNGKEYTSTEEIGVRVIQKPRLEANKPKVPEKAFIGEYQPLEIEFYNMGRTTIYNLLVKVEGENIDVDTPSKYVGNFDSGRSEYFDTGITPMQLGEASCTILYQFEDSAGEKLELRQEYTINVENKPEPEKKNTDDPGMGVTEGDPKFPPMNPEQPQPEKPLWKKPSTWIASGLVIVAFILFMIRRKKKNNAKEDALIKELTLNE